MLIKMQYDQLDVIHFKNNMMNCFSAKNLFAEVVQMSS